MNVDYYDLIVTGGRDYADRDFLFAFLHNAMKIVDGRGMQLT